MHPQARKHLEKILKKCKVIADHDCKYYPCHFESQDCTWCFCPFYPCFDTQTGLEFNEDGWGCSKCRWIHRPEVAKEILEELKLLGINNLEELEKEKEKILDVKKKVLRKTEFT